MTDNTVKIIDLIKELVSIKDMLKQTIQNQQEQIKEADKNISIYKDWIKDSMRNSTESDIAEIIGFAKSQGIII